MGLIRQSESGAHVAKTARFGVRSTRPVVVTVIMNPGPDESFGADLHRAQIALE